MYQLYTFYCLRSWVDIGCASFFKFTEIARTSNYIDYLISRIFTCVQISMATLCHIIYRQFLRSLLSHFHQIISEIYFSESALHPTGIFPVWKITLVGDKVLCWWQPNPKKSKPSSNLVVIPRLVYLTLAWIVNPSNHIALYYVKITLRNDDLKS